MLFYAFVENDFIKHRIFRKAILTDPPNALRRVSCFNQLSSIYNLLKRFFNISL